MKTNHVIALVCLALAAYIVYDQYKKKNSVAATQVLLRDHILMPDHANTTTA